MTGKAFTVFLVILLLALSGCSIVETNQKTGVLEKTSSHEKLPDTFSNGRTKLSVQSDKNTYTFPVDELVLLISNSDANPVEFGEYRVLEKFQEGVWYEIPYKENFAFTDIGLGLGAKEHLEQEMPLEFLDYELTAGTYRIVKIFYINGGAEEVALAAEFEIEE